MCRTWAREVAPEQLSFDDPADDGWDAANQAVDAIRDRFGARLIRPARLAGRPERSGAAPWGPDAPATGGRKIRLATGRAVA